MSLGGGGKEGGGGGDTRLWPHVPPAPPRSPPIPPYPGRRATSMCLEKTGQHGMWGGGQRRDPALAQRRRKDQSKAKAMTRVLGCVTCVNVDT